MKLAFIILTLSLTLSTFAQTGEINIGPVSLTIKGKGNFVCSAQGMMSDRPVLARASSKAEAEILAREECGKVANPFFCKTSECEKDKVNKNDVEVVFNITKDDSHIGISYNGNAKYLCKVEAWNKTYYAKAPTRLEAKVLVSNACADANDGSAFFCEVDNKDCKKISGTEAKAEIDIMGDLFGILKGKPEVSDKERDDRKDFFDFSIKNKSGASKQ